MQYILFCIVRYFYCISIFLVQRAVILNLWNFFPKVQLNIINNQVLNWFGSYAHRSKYSCSHTNFPSCSSCLWNNHALENGFDNIPAVDLHVILNFFIFSEYFSCREFNFIEIILEYNPFSWSVIKYLLDIVIVNACAPFLWNPMRDHIYICHRKF